MNGANLDLGQSAGTVTPEPRTGRGRKAGTQDRTSLAPRLIGIADAATYTGLSYWGVRDLVQTGKVPAVRIPGVRRILIDRADLDRLIDQWKESA